MILNPYTAERRDVFEKYFPMHSQGSRKCIGYHDLCRSCHSISSVFPMNIKKYIPIPHSAVNIESVKITTSLIMMRECLVSVTVTEQKQNTKFNNNSQIRSRSTLPAMLK